MTCPVSEFTSKTSGEVVATARELAWAALFEKAVGVEIGLPGIN